MNNADIGKFLLRFSLGILILLHGVHKVLHGIGPIQSMLAAHHLPVFLMWGVYVGEVLAPAMILLGWFTRLGAALIAVNMLFAIGLAHMGQIYELTRQGGWALELEGIYLMTALAILFLGPGRYKLHS